jgi:hypothetical protein
VDELYTAHFDNPKYLSNLFQNNVGSDFQRFNIQLTSLMVTIDSEPVIHYQKAFDRTKTFADSFATFIRGYKGRASWKVCFLLTRIFFYYYSLLALQQM